MSTAEGVCLARQPIYDRELVLCGYELLYRPFHESNVVPLRPTDAVDGTVMSASTLTAALTDIGLDTIVGTHPAWVNVSAAFLSSDLASALPAERTVLELPAGVVPDTYTLEAIARLRSDGFRIALDGFTWRPELAPLVELADVIKLDQLVHTGVGLDHQLDALAGTGVTLLAAKVESFEVLQHAQARGFELFQGFFFAKPRRIANARVSTEATLRMQLLTRLNEPEASFEALARLIASDVTLSYRLLRYLNSAYVGRPKPVVSVREALLMLGSRRVRSWATLLLLSDSGAGRRELVVTALLRAHMCERLAQATSSDPELAFLVGLLSLADALVDRPLAEVVAELPIDPQLSAALLTREVRSGICSSGCSPTSVATLQPPPSTRWTHA